MGEDYIHLLLMGLEIRQRITDNGTTLQITVEVPKDHQGTMPPFQWWHRISLAELQGVGPELWAHSFAHLMAKAREEYEQALREHREALKANRGPGWNRPALG